MLEILDSQRLKQNPTKYQEKLNNLRRKLLLKAALDPHFLNNPWTVGQMVTDTMYRDDDRDFDALLMVLYATLKKHECKY